MASNNQKNLEDQDQLPNARNSEINTNYKLDRRQYLGFIFN